jgi:hypothetical protein
MEGDVKLPKRIIEVNETRRVGEVLVVRVSAA